MNIFKTEQYTGQNNQEHRDTEKHSSTDCSSARDTNVHPGPAWTPAVWTGPPPGVSLPGVVAPHPHQYAVHPGMVDPLDLSTGPVLDFGPGPGPGPPHNSYHSSLPGPWFTAEPIPCSTIPDEFLCESIYEPLAKSLLQFQEGQTAATPHITHPVPSTERGYGVDAPVSSCYPGPVFLTLKSAPAYREDGFAGEKGVIETGPLHPGGMNISKTEQYTGQNKEHRDTEKHSSTDCSSARDTNIHPGPAWTPAVWTEPPPGVGLPGVAHHPHQHAVHPGMVDPLTLRTTGILRRKPCYCSKSNCLKLYCECFANGVMCSNCNCFNCHNNSEHEMKRHKAMESCLGRNPWAFRSKIVGGKSGEIKGWHYKGCSCKRSGCLKNYCECFEANIECTSSCKCVGCNNCGDSCLMSLIEETVTTRCAVPLISSAQVEATCSSMLVRAEQAEREAQNHVQAERMVLEEFGKCLKKIVNSMSCHEYGTY